MKPTTFTPTFAQPVAVFDVADHASLDQELLAHIYTLKDRYDHSARTNKGGWRNRGNFFNDSAPCVQALSGKIKEAAISFLQACQVEASLEGARVSLTGWSNVNEQGHYNAPHRHLGVDVCGCYYVSQPSTDNLSTGNIEFLDNRNVIPLQQRFGGPVFRTSLPLRPAPGQLVVFPSFLTHWVPPNQSNEARVVIAWNAMVETVADRESKAQQRARRSGRN